MRVNFLLLPIFLITGSMALTTPFYDANVARSNNSMLVQVTSLSRYGVVFFTLSNDTTLGNSISFAAWFMNDKILQFHQYPPPNGTIEGTIPYPNFDTSLTNVSYSHRAFWQATTFDLTFDLSRSPKLTWGENITISVATNAWITPPGNGALPSLYNNYTVTIPIVPSFLAPVDQARAEYTNIAYWVLVLLLYIFCIILVLALGWRQPMKARGIVPALTALTMIGILLGGVGIFLDFKTQLVYSRDFDVFKSPLTIAQAFVVTLGYIRSVIILNANMRKALFVQNKDKSDGNTQVLSMPLWMSVLKRLGHSGFSVFFFILTFIPLQVLFIVVRVTAPNFSLPYISFGFYFVQIILLVIASIYDILSTGRHYWRQGIWKVFLEDPYYLRVESLWFSWILIALVVQLTCNSFMDRGINWYFLAYWNSVTHAVVALYGVFFPVFVSLCVLIRDLSNGSFWKKTSHNMDTLRELLRDPVGKNMFFDYCRAEYSIENASCFEDITMFQLETNPEKKLFMSKRIFAIYLNGSNSELEINLTSAIPAEISTKLKAEEIDNHLFDRALEACISNLGDTFHRFRFKPAFIQFKKTNKFLQESGF
jgi:hypothetical protein